MALQKMIVVGGGDAEYPYQFCAKVNPTDTNEEPKVVNILMPVGGKETGLYRYPKAGERVVVDDDGASTPSYYLMGYLPDAEIRAYNFLSNIKTDEDFTAEKKALEDAQALVLRYEQTGKKTPDDEADDRYSEIGFYRKATPWRTTDINYRDVPPERTEGESDAAYSAWLVASGFPKESGEADADHIKRVIEAAAVVFPRIDRINIQSTGDMRAAARNHQLLKAKRFEVLVDCDDTVHNKVALSKDELPLGDNVGDDSELHAGDAHIRAGNRVVIKAKEEIILQVGKTVVKISDSGLDLISKLVNSNLTNAYDATFTMSGREGIRMFGREVNINADIALGLGDTFGGSFASSLGVVSIGGREITAEGYDAAKYRMLVINALIQYIQCITSGSLGISGNANGRQIKGYVDLTTNLLNDGADIIKELIDVVRLWKQYRTQDVPALTEAMAEDAEQKAKDADKELTDAVKAEKAAKEKLDDTEKKAEDAKQKYEEAEKAYEKAVKAGDPDADAKKKNMEAAYQEKVKADSAKAVSQQAYEDKKQATEKAQTNKDWADDKAKEKRREADAVRDKTVKEAAIDAKEKMELENAEEEAETKKKNIAEELKAGKITQDEADRARDEVDADMAAKKAGIKAQAQADKTKEQADADAKKAMEKANDEEVKATKEADEDAKKAREKADEDLKKTYEQADADAKKAKEEAEAKVKKTKEQADADAKKAKTQADADAKKTKEQADADAKKTKEQADADEKAGKLTKAQADAAKKKADDDAAAKKQKADADALKKKQQADIAAERKKTQTVGVVEGTAKRADEAAAAKKRKADQDARQKKAEVDSDTTRRKTQAAENASRKKKEADEDAYQKKLEAENKAAAKKKPPNP
ncbi:MAG: hypothetical protein LBC31_12890 [Treponema sp.]|jgi:hypothetical protein|nr:hypothetical protein [Treponema sp.]